MELTMAEKAVPDNDADGEVQGVAFIDKILKFFD